MQAQLCEIVFTLDSSRADRVLAKLESCHRLSWSLQLLDFLFCLMPISHLVLPIAKLYIHRSQIPCAEIPTVVRDILYGWARGLAGPFLLDLFAPTTFFHKARMACAHLCLWPCRHRTSGNSTASLQNFPEETRHHSHR